MDPTGGLLTAGGMGLLSYLGQKDTNEANIQLGREQMSFQERMSGTAYQRAVADMQAAGLNPMLAYSQGGASAPVGSMPQIQNAVASGASTAAQTLGLLQGAQQVEQSKAQTQQIAAETARIKSVTYSNQLNTAKLQAEIEQLMGTGDLAKWQGYSAREHYKEMNRRGPQDDDHPDDAKTGFAADVRKRKAESALAEYGLAEAKAGSDFYSSDLGSMHPFIRQLIDILRGLSAAKGVTR